MTHAESPTELLRASGLRVTAPRVAVLQVLAEHPHASADVVVNAVRDELGTVSTQAIYDVLRACCDAGIVRRIEPAGAPALHELRVGDNHHHMICRRCGIVHDVDCAIGDAPCLEPSEDHGFQLDEAEVVYWGLCPQCASATSQEEDTRV